MRRVVLLGALVLANFFPSLVVAQEYTAEQLESFFTRVAGQYEFKTEGLKGDEGFVLREQPILKWTNPVRMQNKGSLFVWADAGRPRIIASIFSFSSSNRVLYRHEIYSRHEQPLKAELNDRVVWEPVASDAKWHAIDGVTPAENEARRLIQMRSIARQFSGEVEEKSGGNINQLKLMPQPLMRYESSAHDVIDGTIFGLALATDPEAYLVMEAIKDPQGEDAHWQYAIVPSSYLAVKVLLDSEVVWEQEKNMELERTFEGQLPLAAKPYFTFFSADRIPSPDTLESELKK